MKITHNKIGQNLNTTIDSAKSNGKADAVDKLGTKGVGKALDPNAGDVSNLGDSPKVELSPRAQEAKRIKELAMSAPDVDEAKVAKFRKLIDEGKYKVDAKDIADRMVDEHLETF